VVIEGVPQHVGEGKDGMAIDLSEGPNYQKEIVLFRNNTTLVTLFPSHNFGLLQALSTRKYPAKFCHLDQFMREKRTAQLYLGYQPPQRH
jgi:hypothetical protein